VWKNAKRSNHDTGIANPIIAVVAGVLVLFALGGAIFAAASLGNDNDEPAAERVYVSLGDSIAAGNGASDPATTGFVPLVAAREDVTAFNVAAAGATTQIVFDEQVARVLSVVQSGRVDFITVAAGGNDLAALVPNASCVQEPLPETCPLETTLDGVEARLSTIIGYLRDANVQAPIVLVAYPNFFSGTGHAFDAPAGRVLPRFNERLEALAARYDRVVVARPAPAFEGRGGELTGVLAEPFDPHPNDAGHAIIADAVQAALEEVE
jgi:lysophospholipase L1-like esterase